MYLWKSPIHTVCFQYTVPFYSHHIFQLGVLGSPPYFPIGKRWAWEPNQATLSTLWASGIGLARQADKWRFSRYLDPSVPLPVQSGGYLVLQLFLPNASIFWSDSSHFTFSLSRNLHILIKDTKRKSLIESQIDIDI